MARGGGEEFVFRGGPGFANRGADASSGGGDFLIGGAAGTLLELVGAVAGEDGVGMCIDESGHDYAALGVDNLEIGIKFAARSGVGDYTVVDDQHAVADDAHVAHFLVDTRASWACERHQFRAIDDGEVHPLLQYRKAFHAHRGDRGL